MRSSIVDFPEPVFPKIANVSPLLREKLTLSSALILVSGYINVTSLNSMLPSILVCVVVLFLI